MLSKKVLAENLINLLAEHDVNMNKYKNVINTSPKLLYPLAIKSVIKFTTNSYISALEFAVKELIVNQHLNDIIENKPLHKKHKLNCQNQIKSMIESIKTLLGKDELEFIKLVNKVQEDNTDIGYIPQLIGGVGGVALAEASIGGGSLGALGSFGVIIPYMGAGVVGACVFYMAYRM